jgi:hypothetical protein
MAKEKFVRSKPHVNFFDGLKQKLFGAPSEEPPTGPYEGDQPDSDWDTQQTGDFNPPVKFVQHQSGANPVEWIRSDSDELTEPPIEPLDERDEARDAGGSMLLPRVGWEVSHDAGDAGTPAEMSAEESDQAAMFNPKELTISKSVPWGTSSGDDVDPAESADVPLMSPETETQHPDFMWLPTSPTPGEAAEGDGQNDTRFLKSRSGHQMDADEDNEALGAEEGSNAGIQQDHVYQHNQTDLSFLKQSAQAAGDAEVEEGGLNSMVHKLPGGSGDAPGDGSFVLPEVGDEVVVGFEQGDMNQPVVLGGLWNGEDQPGELTSPGADAAEATDAEFDPLTTFSFKVMIDAVPDEPGDSTLAGDFKVSETMMPFEAGAAPPGPDAVDFDDIDAELDD